MVFVKGEMELGKSMELSTSANRPWSFRPEAARRSVGARAQAMWLDHGLNVR